MPYTDIFQRYYQENFWGNATSSSGPNSDYRFTPKLCHALEALLKSFAPQSLLDAGCGDANLLHHIDIGEIPYYGLDCVPELITKCQHAFAHRPNMHFAFADILTAELPPAGWVICRDVVHYLPNDLIWKLLKNIQHSGAE